MSQSITAFPSPTVNPDVTARPLTANERAPLKESLSKEMLKAGLNKPEVNKPSSFRTHGPVSDLEMHLPPEWWKTLFNALYLKTDGDVVENEANTAADIDTVISLANLKPDDHVLDLCCGQGRHSLELASRGFLHVSGIDRSRYLVRVGRKRAKQRQLKVAFSEGDARKIRLSESSQDCVCLMGNSFGYFEREEDDRAVLEAVKRVMKNGGRIVLDIVNGEWMRENFEARSWEWIDHNHFVCRERSLASDQQRIVSREVIVHAENGVIADQFYAERLYSKDQIVTLLTRLGFKQVRVHSGVISGSTRGQDLGMMANRMFVTGVLEKAARVMPVKNIARPEIVTVLFNDPSIENRYSAYDTLTGVQDNDEPDIKKILAASTKYTFSYMHEHGNLLQRLMESKPELVLNFCDLGYRNHQAMEMHIPAFLDMMGIPYTGAGPSALALCYDKAAVRAVASELGIPVPHEMLISNDTQSVMLPSYFPAIVKPNLGDGSIGITEESVVSSAEELMNCLDRMKKLVPGSLLIQEFMEGRELTVTVLGNPGSLKVLPVVEIDYSKAKQKGQKPIFGLETQWLDAYADNVDIIPAELDEENRQNLADYCTVLFERLGCRDYARFDFRMDAEGTIKLLEVNPNPGVDGDRFLLAGKLGGMNPEDMLDAIIDAALERTATEHPGSKG